MFRGGQPNPYDDIVAKATDENLTGENWELIINLCDKVQDEGEQGARSVIASLLKRLTHRNPNVQLYTLSLSESLSKNCGIELHREIASRSFTQGLERLVTDRNSHDKVKNKALQLVAMWTAEFKDNPSLGIMEECYNTLKAKNYTFQPPREPTPPSIDDEARRREEEELQRVLEMSLHDKGGRDQWSNYADRAAGGASGSGQSSHQAQHTPAAAATTSSSRTPLSGGAVHASSGYVPARTPSPAGIPPPVSSTPVPASPGVVTRVRALHTFEPTEPGELPFEKNDVIKVIDRNYKDWWRGQLKGRVGIFPVNYVEPLPELTSADLAREAEQEAQVFSQISNIDKLLTMLKGIDAQKDSLADNEEIQELYRSCMALRPKIVKLIDKYSQKRSELMLMNETFVKARKVFDNMMEESLARHTGAYDGGNRQPQSRPQDYGPSPVNPGYGWNSNAYGQQPGYQYQQPAYGPQGPQPYDPSAYAAQPQQYPPATPQPQQNQGQPPMWQQQQAAGAPSQSQQPPQQAQSNVPPQSQQMQQQQPQPQQTQAQTSQPDGTGGQAFGGSGPPYVYDPSYHYPDPNVQAWASYYAQGGTDTAGAVYFISVPGVKEGPQEPHSQAQQPTQQQTQQQSQQHMQPQSQPQSQTGQQTYPQVQPYTQNAGPAQALAQVMNPTPAPEQQTGESGSGAGYQPQNSSLTRQGSLSAGGSQQQQQPPSSPGPQQHQQQSYGWPGQGPASATTGSFPHPGGYSGDSVGTPGIGPQHAAQGAVGGYGSPASLLDGNPQFSQMQGQFAAMHVGDGGPSSPGATRSQQPPTAGVDTLA